MAMYHATRDSRLRKYSIDGRASLPNQERMAAVVACQVGTYFIGKTESHVPAKRLNHLSRQSNVERFDVFRTYLSIQRIVSFANKRLLHAPGTLGG